MFSPHRRQRATVADWHSIERLRRAHAGRSRATSGTVRGALWTALVAIDFFLLSNPVVLIPTFDEALRLVLVVTSVVTLMTLFWMRVPKVAWELLAFFTFAALSSIWSLSSQATWQAVVLYALVAAVATLIAANVTTSVLVDGLTLGGALIVGASLYALESRLPGAAVPLGSTGYMAGVGANRNILAYTLVLSLAAAVSVPPRTLLGGIGRAACIGLILTTTYASASATGILAALVVLAVFAGLAFHDRFGAASSPLMRWMSRAFVLLVGVAAVQVARQVVSSLGKDANSFSNRLPLWQAIVDVMADGQLYIGYGWGAVWPHRWSPAPASDLLTRIRDQAGFPAVHGHNSFLDVLPQLGLIGVALCAVMFLRLGLGVVLLRRGSVRDPADVNLSNFLLVGLAGHLTLGITEPVLTTPVGWFVLVLMVSARCNVASPAATTAERTQTASGSAHPAATVRRT